MSRFTSRAGTSTSDLSKDIRIQDSPGDSISDLRFSPQADHLLAASSWDNTVKVYDINRPGNTKGVTQLGHDAPVLSCCWTSDGQRVFGAGVDKTIRMLDLGAGSQGQTTQIAAAHDEPIRSVQSFIFNQSQMLVTGSWDKTIKYWDLRQQTAIGTITCKDRVYSMSVRNDKLLVVATADRWVHIIDLTNPTTVFKTIRSPMKHETRVVSTSTDGTAYILGGIEGRCAFKHIDDKNASKDFSFKCHRHPQTSSTTDKAYAVNAISVHPVHGTSSTAGSDGTVHIWDTDNKSRVKGFAEVGAAITATDFNKNGNVFAYGVGYDWSKGYAFSKGEEERRIALHEVREDEVKTKAKR
ncbi:hypothetical protein PRZ48_004266 [Zasmidium cellare]|uniref:Uncharacterized protein n=1 Tax=Zasmidium cellare TaxID=395010 RepID=A0ABR0EQ15_ZASCE|nr:hypothetical protein PRZ48_004266 [Zasmidium cellare]